MCCNVQQLVASSPGMGVVLSAIKLSSACKKGVDEEYEFLRIRIKKAFETIVDQLSLGFFLFL